MIHSIRIQNFLSFEDVTIDFNQGLNAVAGKNGSGKTNLLKALAFLGDLLRKPNEAVNTVRKYGGPEVLNNSTKKYGKLQPSIFFTLSFSPPGSIPYIGGMCFFYQVAINYSSSELTFGEKLGLIQRQKTLKNYVDSDVVDIARFDKDNSNLWFVSYKNVLQVFSDFDYSSYLEKYQTKIRGCFESCRVDNLNGLVILGIIPNISITYPNGLRWFDEYYPEVFFSIKQVFCFSTVNLSSIDAFYKKSKSQIVFDNVAKLKSDYSNLIYVLGRLSETDEESYKKVIDAVKRHTIFKDVVEVRPFGKEFKITLIGKGKMHKRPFSFEEFPSGIQNLVAILTAVYSNPPGSLVAIDEPEVFMHTSLIAEMVEELRQSGRIVLISSHQTVTLMSLKKGELIGLRMNPETGCTETIDMTEANVDLDVFDFASQKFSKLLDI